MPEGVRQARAKIEMENRYKILLLDDDTDWLSLCRDLLTNTLPSKPEILTANTARRALTLLETEQIRLLICDLKMPRIDGLQMLAIVRRRFPELRTVVLSALEDEEYRSRAYALGVDLFWLKAEMQRNSKLFNECLESLLGRDSGFRISRHSKQKPHGYHPDGMSFPQFHRAAHHPRPAGGKIMDSGR